MKFYEVHITAFHKYLFDRHFTIQATSDATAASRAIKEFWREPVNRKRKRKTQWLTIKVTY